MKGKVYNQIHSITQHLVSLGLSVQQQFPTRNSEEISWPNYKDLSTVFKEHDYDEMYSELEKDLNYNIKLLDGSLLHFLYRFRNSRILKSHRLAYYPKPRTERYEDNIDDYDHHYYGDSMYQDMIEKNLVAFPVRFDYDNDAAKYIEHTHSYSHLHLGDYKNCRIPVSNPLTPNSFFDFILRHFYPSVYQVYLSKFSLNTTDQFSECISVNEKRSLHIRVQLVH